MAMKIDFINFVPRAGFEKEFRRHLDRLLDESPSDASAQARALFDPDRFVLELSIRSSEGRFRSCVGVPIPRRKTRDRLWQTEALRQLTEEIDRQIRTWRRRRFEGDRTTKAA